MLYNLANECCHLKVTHLSGLTLDWAVDDTMSELLLKSPNAIRISKLYPTFKEEPLMSRRNYQTYGNSEPKLQHSHPPYPLLFFLHSGRSNFIPTATVSTRWVHAMILINDLREHLYTSDQNH